MILEDNTTNFSDEDLDVSFVDGEETTLDNPVEENKDSASTDNVEEVNAEDSEALADENSDKDKPESDLDDTTDEESDSEPQEWKPLSEEEQRELYEKNLAYEKEIAEKKKVIDRQGNELGKDRAYRRKMVELAIPEITEEEKEELERISYDEGQVAFQAAYTKLVEDKRQAAIKQSDEEFERTYNENMAKIKETFPDYEELKEDVYNVLVSDGIPENLARQVSDSPGTEDPFVVGQIIKRAKERKNYANNTSELDRLREENQKLREGIKSGRKNFLQEIDQATRRTHTINNSQNVSRHSSKKTPIASRVEEMDYEDLDIDYVDS